MLVRIVLFLLGAALLAGGGWLGWLKRDAVGDLFPPPAGLDPWLLVAALALICAGLVCIGSAVIPRPKRAAQRAADVERREKAIADADSFYAERARAANSDWRSGDLPAPPAAAPSSAEPPILVSEVAIEPEAQPDAATPVEAQVEPPVAPPPPPPPPPQPAPPPPIPAAAPLQTQPAAAPPAYDHIRLLIDQGRLDEAETELDRTRGQLTSAANPSPLQLAELTGLAGDHASAAGRPGNAKWLWRLALKRFGEAGAAQSPAARHVAEQLRRIDQQ